MNIFDIENIKPMQISTDYIPFNSTDWIYELQLDGIRCIAYLYEDHTDLRDEANRPLLPFFPELSTLHCHVKDCCVLDGEIIILKSGSPDYIELQKRFLHPQYTFPNASSGSFIASFVAFDIIYLRDRYFIDTPLFMRKLLLETLIDETIDFTISQYTDTFGIKLFKLAQSINQTGVIAKRKDSYYQLGTLSKDWVSFSKKSLQIYLLCGILTLPNGHNFALLCDIKNNISYYKCAISISNYGDDETELIDFIYRHTKGVSICPLTIRPVLSNECFTSWFSPELHCSIAYDSKKEKGYAKGTFRGICELHA